ncbi:acyl-CoA synthetase [Alkalihalophilus pseudofirmus]|nr:acyl-CoA synthetase [Alkalihalophilus pseudofirmus]
MSNESFKQILGSENELVTKMLEKWAKETGERTFIFYGEENRSYTYSEVNELVNSIAHNLLKNGIKKGDRISLFLKNPLITTLAMFGIWKVGAVFCPINFNYKGKLLSYQINDTNPKILITENQMVPLINEIKDEISTLDVIMHNPEQGDPDYHLDLANVQLDKTFHSFSFKDFLVGETSNPNIELNYWDTANIIYTSGTTGPAKGVVQSYRWINGYTFLFRSFNHQEDVIYNDLPLYHVGGAFALVARAVFVGCSVAIWDKFSPKDFWRRIKVSGCTDAILLDVMIPWLMKEEPSENDRMNTLKVVYMQPLPQYHHEVAKRFGFDFVLAGFGQTEAGNGFLSIIEELEDGEGTPSELYKGYSRNMLKEIAENLNIPIKKGTDPLGKGFMGVPSPLYDVAILNEQDEKCTSNEAGQIGFRPLFPHIVLREYFNKPKATVEVFQNLWFHTGDVGYKDKNGIYYFVDRMKDVMRSRGENISSYQVEDIINQHEYVKMSAAFPIPAAEGSEDDIVVYIVLNQKSIDENGLLEWAKTKMPKFMWPKHIRLISELPRTPTNKVEKYKLKEKFLKEIRK